MTRQSERKLGEVYITPDEQQLLARVARASGVGRDYLALRGAKHGKSASIGRPIPRWLGKPTRDTPHPPAPNSPRSQRQSRHCHTCAHLSQWLQAGEAGRYICAAGLWTRPLCKESVHTSRRLRELSLSCPHYVPTEQPPRVVPHHCRACQELLPADTADERYVCGKAVWTNPMKPQSVANARRLERLSSTCSHFVARHDRWLPRSRKREEVDETPSTVSQSPDRSGYC